MAARISDPRDGEGTATITPQPERRRQERWRLPLHHRHTLMDLFQGTEESRAGIRTRYLPDGSHGGSDDEGVVLHDLERFVELTGGFGRNEWRREIDRARAALARLRGGDDHASVGALAVVYGHADPSTRAWPIDAVRFVGELAPLVRYCDATEQRRRRMARERALRHARQLDVVAIARVAMCERDELRMLTSGDAVDDALDVHPERRPRPHYVEPRTAHEERVRTWEHRRRERRMGTASFLVAAREECAAMLEQASRRYHAAWLAVGARTS